MSSLYNEICRCDESLEQQRQEKNKAERTLKNSLLKRKNAIILGIVMTAISALFIIPAVLSSIYYLLFTAFGATLAVASFKKATNQKEIIENTKMLIDNIKRDMANTSEYERSLLKEYDGTTAYIQPVTQPVKNSVTTNQIASESNMGLGE